MTLSIKNGGYAFLIRLDLMFSMSLWKEFQLLQILNDLSIRYLIESIYQALVIIAQFLFCHVFTKILKRVMYNRLYKYLTCKKIWYPQQFGFQKGFSTEHVTQHLVDQIYESFENKNYTVGIFLDFSKAFIKLII